jgi:hypothetical protein
MAQALFATVGMIFTRVFRFEKRKKPEQGVFTLGFPEYVSVDVIAASDDVYDLENDIGGFGYSLPRVNVC